ncbi:M56 family metallopeptidase [Nonlabens marinus]|uniref:Regulatory sensor-transducer, BlaR1/MecR1 family / TonB-dependent receptor n=1 Tax=Nonlabens marinus S1-08 TaxID=1454201 RepID=W8VZU7_9FLAO|nr:M56 family metallopeptidase [Nonlabens marinus]BAO55196.1 regulatory sensor-transducer, BlaR1/MecR1 family / TonB-dependent receptor [Nonlabens marinus S1-08]
MEHFFINSSVCLFSLWLVYKLLLENTSWHHFKRYYFIAAVVISAVIPFLVVRTVVVPFTSGNTIDLTAMELMPSEVVETGLTWDWSLVLLGFYSIGVLLMGIRFIKNLYDLRIKSTDEVSTYSQYKLILRELVQVPHSFLNNIYASITDYKSGAIPDTVLQHEKAHLDQKHSIDILFIELLIVVMWFNPLLYLFKYSMKLNHEFLADQAVLTNGVGTKEYQETLLAYSSNSQNRALVNTFNFPIIKKRFTIMKTHTTTASGLVRSLAIIPVLALLVISCGQEEVVVEPEVIEIVEVPIDESKSIMLDIQRKEGTVTVDGKKYSFKRIDNKFKFYDKEGKEQDLESQGYEIIEIEEVEIREVEDNELFRGKKISDSKRIVSPINEDFTYDLKSNKAIESSITDLKKSYGDDVIVISEIAEVNGHKYYYAQDRSGKLFLNKYFEVVDLRGVSSGKINVSKFILPPPPPPLSPLEFIEANKEDLTYYIDDRKVSYKGAVSAIKLTGQQDIQILPDANGNMSVKIIMTDAKRKLLPPPPQPWFTHTPTLLKGMQNGSIKLLINGKLASTAQAKSLPDNWNINDFRVKKENGITVIEYSGQLN